MPTSSNKELSRYIKRLLSTGKKSDTVVTKFSLKRAVNKGGISYSQVQFAIDRTLSNEEIKLIKKFSMQIKFYTESRNSNQESPNIDINTGEVLDFGNLEGFK